MKLDIVVAFQVGSQAALPLLYTACPGWVNNPTHYLSQMPFVLNNLTTLRGSLELRNQDAERHMLPSLKTVLYDDICISKKN